MKNKILLFILIAAIAAVLAGCTHYINYSAIDIDEDPARINEFPNSIKEYLNGIGDTVYNLSDEPEGARPDPRDELPKKAREHLNELGDMEYKGGFTVTLEHSDQAVSLHNDLIPPIGYKIGSAEWDMGGLTSLFSQLFMKGRLVRFIAASYDFDTSDVLMEHGEYYGYVYTLVKKDADFGESKGCMIIIEKEAEPDDDPHMYIWSYDRVFGVSRPGMSIPSDEKVYEYYKEFGGNEDPEAIIHEY